MLAAYLGGGVISLGSLVGFLTVFGIAARNGILMVNHCQHLEEHEGETFEKKMILPDTMERIDPVMLTTLVAALALIPLTLDPQAPGKEILYPVATVILGGLVSSTLLDMIVTPVVFYQFGKDSIKEYFEHRGKDAL